MKPLYLDENIKNHPISSSAEAELIWNEYKYRHDLIWRYLIQSTLVLVGLVTIRYTQVFAPNYYLTVLAFVVALLYWFFTFFSVKKELVLYKQVKAWHRQRQEFYLCYDPFGSDIFFKDFDKGSFGQSRFGSFLNKIEEILFKDFEARVESFINLSAFGDHLFGAVSSM